MNENRLPDYLDHMQQAATDASAFVEGLLRGADTPMVFLDRQMRILRHTPSARGLFHLGSADQGRPLSAIKARIADEDSVAQVQAVLKVKPSRKRWCTSVCMELYIAFAPVS